MVLARTLACSMAMILLAASDAQELPQAPRELEIGRVGDEVRIVWDGKAGTTFFPQFSSNLNEWRFFDELCFGEGEQRQVYQGDASSQFFRVQIAEVPVEPEDEARTADFDQDGLSNQEEIGRVGSNPMLADTDADGLPDGWEDAHRLNVLDDGTLDPIRGPGAPFGGGASKLVYDPGGEGIPRESNLSISNLAAFQAGVQARGSASLSDLDGDGVRNEEDFDPHSDIITWKKRDWPIQFAFIELNGWDRTLHGFVRAINNQGDVVADKAVYRGVGWTSLAGIRSSFEGPPTPVDYQFEIDGRRHSSGILSLPRAGWISDDGVVMGNGRLSIFSLTVVDPETGEDTVHGVGSQPEFAFVWSTPDSEPEIFGQSKDRDIVGSLHSEKGALGRDGSIALLQKQFEDGVVVSNAFRFILVDSLGVVRVSNPLPSPSLPSRVENGAAVAFRTFSFPPASYRKWSWMPGDVSPRTLWSAWQFDGETPSEYLVPEVIGRLPGGDVCMSVGGRTFTHRNSRWHEMEGLHGATHASASGLVVVKRSSEPAAVLNGGEAIPLADLTSDVTGPESEFVIEDVNDDGVILAREVGAGVVERAGLLVPVEMVPDFNRDGRINEEDRGRVSPSNPWRWWVNDDDDYVRRENGDIPDSESPDGLDLQVDGMRDLIDFFPLHLDLRKLLKLMPAGSFEYRLCHEDGAFNVLSFAAAELESTSPSIAVNAHFTSITRGIGLERQQVEHVDADGVVLSGQFLSRAGIGGGLFCWKVDRRPQNP
ncbi:MAG: hypothetical protein AAGI48_02185 [Verrucomicrobiota bacterium]